MALRTLGAIATMVAAVSSAVNKKQRLNLEDPGSTPIKECPLFPDVIGVILSFLAPFEWNDMFSVNRLFHASKPITIANLKQAWPNFDYSPELDIGDALKRVMKQPGWKGVIANEQDYLIIDYPSEEDKNKVIVPYSGKVRITGVQDKVNVHLQFTNDETQCADHFIHRTRRKGQWPNVRNVRTGENIRVAENLDLNGKTVLVNEEQLVCIKPDVFSVHQLNWKQKISTVIFRKSLDSLPISRNGLMCDESGNIYSVISSDDYTQRILKYNWKTEESSWVGPKYDSAYPIVSSDQRWIFTRDNRNNEIKIESVNGKQCCLCVPSSLFDTFEPSPNERFVLFELKPKLFLQNLHSGKVTVIAEESINSVKWITDHLFLIFSMKNTVVRSVLNPCVDLDCGPADYLFADYSVINSLSCSSIGSVLNWKDIMIHVSRIGENLFFIDRKQMVIKVEWLEQDEQ